MNQPMNKVYAYVCKFFICASGTVPNSSSTPFHARLDMKSPSSQIRNPFQEIINYRTVTKETLALKSHGSRHGRSSKIFLLSKRKPKPQQQQ